MRLLRSRERPLACLMRRRRAGARYYAQGLQCQAAVASRPTPWQGIAMSKDDSGTTREERLAAKLRENLKRRKAQARALDQEGNPALPKSPPKS